MPIPNADSAIIDEQKVVGYLLNTEHRRGGSKAALLLHFGYDPSDWQRLAEDLRRDHLSAEAESVKTTPYGTRFDIRAPVATPSGRTVFLRSIWQIDAGLSAPRLITLFPD